MLSTNRHFHFLHSALTATAAVYLPSHSSDTNTICHAVNEPVRQHRHFRFFTFGWEHVEEWRSVHASWHNTAVGRRCWLLHLQQRASCLTREENVNVEVWEMKPGERSVNSSGEIKWKRWLWAGVLGWLPTWISFYNSYLLFEAVISLIIV